MTDQNSYSPRVAGGASDGQYTSPKTNQLGHALTSRGLPDFVEMERKYGAIQIQTATLFAPLVAVPSTAAALEVWVQSAGTNALVVESLFADQILATAAAQEYAIYAMVTVTKAIPSLTALTVTKVNGDAPYTPTVGTELVTGVGTTVVANGWRPYGPPHGGALAAATPMGSWEAPINGRLIVRPGHSLCVHIVGSLATASSFQCGVQGYMVPTAALAA